MNLILKSNVALLLFLAIFFSMVGTSQADDDKSKPTLDDIEWLVGNWQGSGFGGICEEVWLPASAGSMVGTFKMSINGKVQFYEMMTITIDSSGPILHLKHFNADMTGWEKKDEVVTFNFNHAKKNELSIGALTYTKVGADSLYIIVVTSNKDGSTSQETIRCRLVE